MGKKLLEKYIEAISVEKSIYSNIELIALYRLAEIASYAHIKIKGDGAAIFSTSLMIGIFSGSGTGKSTPLNVAGEMLNETRFKVIGELDKDGKKVGNYINNSPTTPETEQGMMSAAAMSSRNKVGISVMKDEFFSTEQGLASFGSSGLIKGSEAYDNGKIASGLFASTRIEEDRNMDFVTLNMLLMGAPHRMLESSTQSKEFLDLCYSSLGRRTIVSYIGGEEEERLAEKRELDDKRKKITAEDVEKRRKTTAQQQKIVSDKIFERYSSGKKIAGARTTSQAEAKLIELSSSTHINNLDYYIGHSESGRSFVDLLLTNRNIGTLKIATIFAFFDDDRRSKQRKDGRILMQISEQHIEDAFEIVEKHEKQFLLLFREMTRTDEMIICDFVKKKMRQSESNSYLLSILEIGKLPLNQKIFDIKEIYQRLRIGNEIGFYCNMNGHFIEFRKRNNGKQKYRVCISGEFIASEDRLQFKAMQSNGEVVTKTIKNGIDHLPDLKYSFIEGDRKIDIVNCTFKKHTRYSGDSIIVKSVQKAKWGGIAYANILVDLETLLSLPMRDITFHNILVEDGGSSETGGRKKHIAFPTPIDFVIFDVDKSTRTMQDVARNISYNCVVAHSSDIFKDNYYRVILPLNQPVLCKSREHYKEIRDEVLMFLNLGIVVDRLSPKNKVVGYSTSWDYAVRKTRGKNIDFGMIVESNLKFRKKEVYNEKTRLDFDDVMISRQEMEPKKRPFIGRISEKQEKKSIDALFNILFREEVRKKSNNKNYAQEGVIELKKELTRRSKEKFILLDDENFVDVFLRANGIRKESLGMTFRKMIEHGRPLQQIWSFYMKNVAEKIGDSTYIGTLISQKGGELEQNKATQEAVKIFIHDLLIENMEEKENQLKLIGIDYSVRNDKRNKLENKFLEDARNLREKIENKKGNEK